MKSRSARTRRKNVTRSIGETCGCGLIDDEWGEASGEKIILEKGNRMAKVVAGKNGRSKLELPPIPNLGFGKKPKKTNFK